MYGLNIPAKSKNTRMEIPYIGVELTPLSKTRTKMRLVTTFDPQITWVPMKVISWVAKKVKWSNISVYILFRVQYICLKLLLKLLRS